MIPVSGGVALTLFTMCAVWVILSKIQQSSSTDHTFELYSRGPKSLIAHSIFYGFFSGACRCIFVHKSAYTEAHHDSGLSLMITALSSLATKLEEMGWVLLPFFFFSQSTRWNGIDDLCLLYVSTRVGLVLTGSSFFALFSFVLQDALLGTRFNWVTPSVFSGVSAFFI